MITGLSPSNQQILNSINASQANLNKAQQQVSSGLRISRASDDPQIITDVFETRSDLAQVNQVSSNLTAVNTEVSTADSSVQNAVQLLEQAGVLGNQGTNSNLDASQRQNLANQVDGILQQIVTISRTEVNGDYIFGGDQSSTPPYTIDASGNVQQLTNAPSTRLIQDTSGLTFAVAKTAQDLFDVRDASNNPTTGNVFAALQSLKTALLANDPTAIATATDAVTSAHDYLNNEGSFYGAVGNRISTALDLAQKFQTSDQARLSSEQDADVAAAALQITQDTSQITAGLESAAKQITTSLFDYLPPG